MRWYHRFTRPGSAHWYDMARPNGNYNSDKNRDIPLICVCHVPRPDSFGECSTCKRPWMGSWKPRQRAAARRSYPELRKQQEPVR
jgi:hypothetical protein